MYTPLPEEGYGSLPPKFINGSARVLPPLVRGLSFQSSTTSPTDCRFQFRGYVAKSHPNLAEWDRRESNPRPLGFQPSALNQSELQPHIFYCVRVMGFEPTKH